MFSIICNKKRIYSQPFVERIKLDAEISLVLNSYPPAPESINGFNTPEYLNNNPIQNNVI